MDRVIFESIFSFFEMLISLFFATGIFRKKLDGKRAILFSVFGAVLLTLREYVFRWLPDIVPAVLIFTLYAIGICRAKWWAAVSWSLVNYLFIGIIVIGVDYISRIYIGSFVEMEGTVGAIWFFPHIRNLQLFIAETGK